MIIEYYDANPAANDFSYVNVTLNRTMRCKWYFVHSQTNTFTGWVFIYRGTVVAYNTANEENALLVRRWIAPATGFLNPTELVDVELAAGDYTFAAETVPDTTILRWAFMLV